MLNKTIQEYHDKLNDCTNKKTQLKLVWGWIKQGTLSFKDFEILMDSLYNNKYVK